MDYAIFDSLLDSVIIVGGDREILYANEVAAALCESSVRRLIGRKKIHEVIEFADSNLFVMPGGTWGENQATPITEIAFRLTTGKEGKVQMAIQPFTEASGERRWIVIMRDVTLEEILHGKYRAELEQKEGVIVELQKAQKELEAYSKNLEQMVEERTKEVKRANRMLNAIMNSLGQGFLVFDENGRCSDIYTKACEDILETIPAGQEIVRVLNLTATEEQQFRTWMKALFDEALPFESMKDLGPKLYHHSQRRHITLDYFAIRSENERISNLVLVATDKTAEHEAGLALERERQYAKMVIKLVTNRKQFAQFLDGVKRYVADVRALIPADARGRFDHGEAFRLLHTLEGEAGVFSATGLKDGARRAQEVIEPLKAGSQSLSSDLLRNFRAAIDGLEEALKKFWTDNRVLFQALRLDAEKTLEVPVREMDRLMKLLASSGVPKHVQADFYEQILRQPIGELLNHFNDVTSLVAEKQGKRVKPITVTGGELKILPDRYEALFSSLVHVFRNAVDHGIEPPDEREFVGKDPEGSIRIFVERTAGPGGAELILRIEDDGQGINPSAIRRKLGEKRPDLSLDKVSDDDVIQHIFDAGFSSRSEIGEFSGRGVGMDAVKTEVERLGGRVRVVSVQGQGTTLWIHLPEPAERVPRAA